MAPTGGPSVCGTKIGATLREASARGDVQKVALLLQTSMSAINESDENGCTALQRAAADGHSEVVRLLMQNGADPNRQDSMHGNTALHEAAWKGYSRCVALLATRAALHIPNNGGFAPLHLACQNGHNQTCREILLAGCEPDIQNNYGDSSLHTSARYGHAGVTRILISAECHVSDQNKNGDTALHIAAAMGRRKLTRILLEAGCNKVLKNKQNETAKDIAIRKDLHEIVDIINSPNAKVKKESKKKDKPRDKSAEKTIDKPDGDVEKVTKRKNKDKDVNQSPGKHKEKKKTKNVHFETNGKNWSPYGCHYYPDPRNFPKPKLDSLPKEPLKKGEQYFLDLAGNICKGPVGVGYTCYCAPFFRHMEDKLNRDKIELKNHIDKAHEKLDQKVSNLERKTQGQISELTRCVAAERVLCKERQQHLEHWLTRGMMFRQSERVRKLDFSPKGSVDIAPLKRTRSLEMLDASSRTWNIIKTFNDKNHEGFGKLLNKSSRMTSKSADILDTTSPDRMKSSNKSLLENCVMNDRLNSSYSERTKSRGASGKSSEKSISLASCGSEAARKTHKYDRNSSQSTTAEIHVKSNNVSISQSPCSRDIHLNSESDDRLSSHSKTSNRSILKGKSIMRNQWVTDNVENIEEIHIKGNTAVTEHNKIDDKYSKDPLLVQNKNCLDGIENDGYIKISRFDDGQMAISPGPYNNSMCLINPRLDNSFPNEMTTDGRNENCPRRSVHELVARIQDRQYFDEIHHLSRSPTRDPSGRFSGNVSRSLSPNYISTSPSQAMDKTWQNNTIPLSENTHFNTIEPINQSSIQSNQPAVNKVASGAKSSKKFSFHNLIPFPTRKMFNFQHKSDGNQSESSDEEDTPVRSTLEPGLMQNSNLLTTLPLPNYENMLANQNAQPQSPAKTDINGHCVQTNHVGVRSSILPIPKDAYFHEIPNKQRFHDSQIYPRSPNNHLHPHFKTPHVPKHFPNEIKTTDSSVHTNYGRNRNPVYSPNGLLGEMMHDHIDREMARTPHSYTSQLDQNAEIEISTINNCTGYHGQISAEALRPMLSTNHYRPHGHIENNIQNPIDMSFPNHMPNDVHLHNRMQNLAINTHLSELQSQLDRDSHNDSGYSTKVYGSSQGASPSLSGNVDCSESAPNQKLGLAINRSLMNSVNHSPHPHIGASSLV